MIDLSSEGVEDTIDPALEIKLKLLSLVDASGSHSLRLIARSSAAAFSLGVRSSSSLPPPVGEGQIPVRFRRGDLIRH